MLFSGDQESCFGLLTVRGCFNGVQMENKNVKMGRIWELAINKLIPKLSSVALSSVNVLFCPLQNKTLPLENTTDCLSTMASVCKVMLETP